VISVSTDTAFLLGSILGPGGAALAIASRYLPRPRTTPFTAPAAEPRPDAHMACHTTVCAHMSTAHDRTPAGLVCRGCGNTKETL
jgi:hypothetical protein